MSAWGNRSSSPLLKRISASSTSDAPITTLTLLPGKTWSSSNEATALTLFNQLKEVQLSGKKLYDPPAAGKALSSPTCAVATLKVGDRSFDDKDLEALVTGTGR